jgi:glutamate formiminotransferase
MHDLNLRIFKLYKAAKVEVSKYNSKVSVIWSLVVVHAPLARLTSLIEVSTFFYETNSEKREQMYN